MMRHTWLTIAVVVFSSAVGSADDVAVPVITGPWTRIAGNPDLGEFTSDRQQPVDFAIWQAADGTWQAWSCIRHTKCGGHTRLFYRWEGESLTEADWKPMGIAMQADPQLGENIGGLQAPHVVREGGRFHMFYGDWDHICHAVSDDGKTFQRVILPSGKTGLFTEGAGANTRDIMMLKVGDVWHGYYTAFPTHQGAVYLRTTRDFLRWSESAVVAFGGITGTGPCTAECPHVVRHGDRYYLFRTQAYGPNNITSVYHSTDPAMFGINQDSRYLATRLSVAAPEIIRHDGKDYIVALTPQIDGLRVARLSWKQKPTIGQPVFDFDDARQRQGWTVESGNLPGSFTTSTRSNFSPPGEHFISTSELPENKFDDAPKGTIRSPEFTVTVREYAAYVSGGADFERLYLSLIDAETNQELRRIVNDVDSNVLQPHLIDTSDLSGRRVYLRLTDNADQGWGHINFGGLYTVVQ